MRTWVSCPRRSMAMISPSLKIQPASRQVLCSDGEASCGLPLVATLLSSALTMEVPFNSWSPASCRPQSSLPVWIRRAQGLVAGPFRAKGPNGVVPVGTQGPVVRNWTAARIGTPDRAQSGLNHYRREPRQPARSRPWRLPRTTSARERVSGRSAASNPATCVRHPCRPRGLPHQDLLRRRN